MPVIGMNLASQVFDISHHFRDDRKFDNTWESLSRRGEKDAQAGSSPHFSSASLRAPALQATLRKDWRGGTGGPQEIAQPPQP